MKRVLVTGMSGTGKTSALRELARREYRTVDTDVGDWREWRQVVGPSSEIENDLVWIEERIETLLDDASDPALFVSGTVINQGTLYPQFDEVVLFSARPEVMFERIQSRTDNPYGKRAGEWARILSDLATVEPLLRRGCTFEIDTSDLTIGEVADRLEALVERDPIFPALNIGKTPPARAGSDRAGLSCQDPPGDG